jgi:protein-S-isoprenylcysteine O-methyltransferase Ste14
MQVSQEKEDLTWAVVTYSLAILGCFVLVYFLAVNFPDLIFWTVVLVCLVPAGAAVWNWFTLRREIKNLHQEVEKELNDQTRQRKHD